LALASQNHRFARNFLTKRYSLFVSLARESKIAPAVSWLIVSRVGTLANLSDGSAVPIKEGGRYAARIRAIHPVTARPVPGVSVQTSLNLDTDDNNPLLTRPALTDRRGFATLEFTLPDKSTRTKSM
jgi:hypothetical protein